VTTSRRRIGDPASKTRARLVEAAEAILLDEGYAGVTSRRVGAKAGLKPQLIHYYFRSMDDLFLEVFRRRADENLVRVERALAADETLRSLWKLNAELGGVAFNVEFMALANRNKAIRAEVARYAERYRAMQLDALTRALDARDDTGALPPVVALLLMTGLTQVLSLERALGVTAGHDEALAFVARVIDRLEPPTDRS